MKIISLDQPLDIDAAAPAPRSIGLHVSTIYNDLYQDLDPDRYSKDGEPHQILMAIGLSWEQWLERTLIAMGECVARPGELISPEGIIYSPDLHVLNGVERLGEIKSTCMSSREGIEAPKFAKWHCQAKIYCYWTSIPRMRFYVLFLRGDYRKGDGFPEFKVWDVEYGARELQENRCMLINHAHSKEMLE
jgi:hypothetical protein